MVYAISVQLTGRFHPSAECPEWDANIERIYREELSDADKFNFPYLGMFRRHVLACFEESDGPIPYEWRVHSWEVKSNTAPSGNLLKLPIGLAISEPLRDAIEEIEPGIHQFWQVEICKKSKRGKASITEGKNTS